MSFLDTIKSWSPFGGKPQAAAPVGVPSLPGPSSPAFRRKRPQAPRNETLERWCTYVEREVNANAEPLTLPLAALRRMDGDPIVYLGEWAITALVRKPDLYHVVSPLGEAKQQLEVEEWLWPLLPDLLPALARAFLWGAIPYVFDLERGDLVLRVPAKDKPGETRQATLPARWHFTRVHELWPGQVTLRTNAAGDLLSLYDHVGERRYGAGRAFVATWDKQFGDLRGQAARRRAWPSFAKSRIIQLLEARYLERAVHTPLAIYATGDTIPGEEGDDGDDISVADYIAQQLEELRGGGTITLPGDMSERGDRLFSLQPIEIPERGEEFDRALNRFDVHTLAAYFTPAALAGMDDASGAGGRVLAKTYQTLVTGLVEFVACKLTEIVDVVHALNEAKGVAAEVKAAQIPSEVQKLYLEVFKEVSAASGAGAQVDTRALLERLEVPTRPEGDEEAKKKREEDQGRGRPGRPRDATSDRERRREDARDEEAGDDTGAPDGGGREAVAFAQLRAAEAAYARAQAAYGQARRLEPQ